MSDKAKKQIRTLKIIEDDPNLRAFEGDLNERVRHFKQRKKELLAPGQTLTDFASGHLYYGFHKVKGGWVYREWAPGATAMHLIGEFNNWNRTSHPMTAVGNGSWEIMIPGARTLKHRSKVKVAVTSARGTEDRIPLYATYVVQDEKTHNFSAAIWNPRKEFVWTDQKFRPKKNVPPIIYEAHVGMATEEERVGTYLEFMRDILPRIKKDGYNTVQLMAIMEHPYYASFGYQVSNFFAASSWYGTPDDLKALINEAHAMGLSVLLDLVHSHAVKNTAEGINGFDGRDDQFFKSGGAGDHPAWGSKVFDYGKNGVVHFLLSNVRFWLEEYHFDGFRFDGVTSMIYLDHGLGSAFTDYRQYFSMNTDVQAVAYLQLAAELTHEFKRGALCVAEEMSGMPGMCLPVKDGGIGFDYRLSMGLPDFFIKTIKEKQDGQWNMGRLYYELISRRPGEKNIAYAESHDQALVGDKTLMFRLADKEMYWGMNRGYENMVVERAVALHKMIRLVTIAAGGEGYLNFMGNEFGHPEWIDFPREGNGWSYKYARRQWSLVDREDLKYKFLGKFDEDIIHLVRSKRNFQATPVEKLWDKDDDQVLAFKRGDLVFVFNFNPSKSFSDYGILAPEGCYSHVLNSDQDIYGGYNNIDTTVKHLTISDPLYQPHGIGWLKLYLPARSVQVLRYKK